MHVAQGPGYPPSPARGNGRRENDGNTGLTCGDEAVTHEWEVGGGLGHVAVTRIRNSVPQDRNEIHKPKIRKGPISVDTNFVLASERPPPPWGAGVLPLSHGLLQRPPLLLFFATTGSQTWS